MQHCDTLGMPSTHLHRHARGRLIRLGARTRASPARRVAASAEAPSPGASGTQRSEAAAASSSNSQEEVLESVFAQLLKPLRDFGIGRTSLLQGAVGLFVFSGIGRWQKTYVGAHPTSTKPCFTSSGPDIGQDLA